MIRVQTLERARPARRAVRKPQFEGFVTDLIVPEASGHPRPQAFLVEQQAHWSLRTHFHLEHQFQAFVGGSATLGKHAVGPLTVHYASPHSAYGPLNAGAAGISYGGDTPIDHCETDMTFYQNYPQLTDYAIEAARRAGIKAELRPIRGGTDGSNLTARGLPTPNLFTGGHNFHGKLEFNSRKGLEKSTETLVNLVQIWAEKSK